MGFIINIVIAIIVVLCAIFLIACIVAMIVLIVKLIKELLHLQLRYCVYENYDIIFLYDTIL